MPQGVTIDAANGRINRVLPSPAGGPIEGLATVTVRDPGGLLTHLGAGLLGLRHDDHV